MSATIIVVNYNGEQFLPKCLAALSEQTLRCDVLVIDNASNDESLRNAFARFPQFDYLPLRRNTGFARAANIGITRVSSEFVIFLNPDTIPDFEFVNRVLEPFGSNERLAAASGTLVFESHPEVIASAGINIHRNGVAIDAKLGEPLATGESAQPVFGASGGASAFRRRALLEVGGFPEHFFMYLEDVDLAWRLRLRGWESVWIPRAVALHGYSSASGEGSAFKHRLQSRNRLWTLVRCLPDELVRRDWHLIALHDSSVLGYSLLAREWATIGGRAEGLVRLAPRLCERREIQQNRIASLDDLQRWILPAMAPSELLQKRRLTSSLAHGVVPHSSEPAT